MRGPVFHIIEHKGPHPLRVGNNGSKVASVLQPSSADRATVGRRRVRRLCGQSSVRSGRSDDFLGPFGRAGDRRSLREDIRRMAFLNSGRLILPSSSSSTADRMDDTGMSP